MGLSRVFDISRRSLATYQTAMDITSHNVANVSNENYSRQKISFTTEAPQKTANFIWGSGVKIDDIVRVRNQMIDSQLRNSYSSFYGNEQESLVLAEIEEVFSEPSELGLSTTLTEFFNAWNELSVSPNSMALRYQVAQKTEQLSERFKIVYNNLNEISYDTTQNFASKTENLNTLLQQVHSINRQIVDSGMTGISANDLMDQRDYYIDEIAKLANISVVLDDNNAAIISIGGVQAVDANSLVQFDAKVINDTLTISARNNDVYIKLTGGELFGLSQIYSQRIPDYQTRLDDIANSLVTNTNAFHQTGYTLENPPQTGLAFFDGYEMGVITINPEILSDASKIAASSNGSEGNGQVANNIANLSTSKILNGISINDNYAQMISKLGNDKQKVDSITKSTDLIIEQLKVQKGTVSGVSLDEEMTNIIRFQRSYDASAKLISIAEEMLETLINMV